MKVLQGLCLGTVEESAYFPGVGAKTFQALIDKGWIKEAYDPTYGVQGYRITEEGSAVYDQASNPRARIAPRLTMLKPRLSELPPRITPLKKR
jgi:hypothetical protein